MAENCIPQLQSEGDSSSENLGRRSQNESKSSVSWWLILLISFSLYYFCTKFILSNSTSDESLQPLWKFGEKAKLEIYIARDQKSLQPTLLGSDIVWSKKDITYGGNHEYHFTAVNVTIPKQTLTDSSLILAAYLRKVPSIESFETSPFNTLVFHHQLLKVPPKKTLQAGRNLLFDESTKQSLTNSLCWYPNITIQFVSDVKPLPKILPQFMRQHMFVFPDHHGYLPPFYVNDFWNLREHCIPVNASIESDTVFSLGISFECIPFWRFQMATQFAASIKHQEDTYGIDTEDIKKLIGETNTILLLVTFVVTLLHTIFDILAFKNDVQFWRKKQVKDLQGLSVRSIFLNAISQFVIFLYLLEEGTTWLILASALFGIFLDVWKIFKVVQITFDSFRIRLQFKKEYQDSLSKTYDDMALKYLSWIAIPLLILYSIYSLLYQTYSGWYSFIIKTLVGFVYTFGFIMMTPQLFINYRLKSVAHMPWRTFVYKALNTFIDDLFAFVIRMPTLHRLACLRDDVVFIIYLYQWYLYPVDNKRPNEFGQSEHDD